MKPILILISALLLSACQQTPVQPTPGALEAVATARSADLAEQVNDASAKRFDSVEQRMTLIQEKLLEQAQQQQRISLQNQQQLTLLQWLQQSQQIQAKQLADRQAEPSALDQLTELVFRLEQMSAESERRSETESEAQASVITEPVFELVSVYGAKGWVVLKYDSRSGSTWKADAGNWAVIKEVGVLPESAYQVVMEPIANDVRGYVAARIDRNNGITWWLKDNQWEPF